MFRKLTILSLVLAFTFSTLAPNRSHATVGATLLTGGAFDIVLGALLIGGGSLSLYASYKHYEELEKCHDSSPCVDKHFSSTIAFLIFGIVFLDENTGIYELSELTPELAQKYGIDDPEQVRHYNEDLPHLNQIYAQMQASYNSGDLQSMEQIKNRWLEYKDQVSPEGFIAFQRVIQSTLN